MNIKGRDKEHVFRIRFWSHLGLIMCVTFLILQRNMTFHFQRNTVYVNLIQRFSTWGTRTPRSTWEAHRGYAKFNKNAQKEPFWEEFLIWGYTKGIQFWFGCTQMGSILIWGYAGTKRLRTPDLIKHKQLQCRSQASTRKYDLNLPFESLKIYVKYCFKNKSNICDFYFVLPWVKFYSMFVI
jgi:hypothetical protein